MLMGMGARGDNPPTGVRVRQVRCKSILSDSGISDYSLNCYVGCAHACAYCYARFMGRFHHPGQRWGSFVDAKVNAPEVLARRLGRSRALRPPSVFVSSVCDPYQPAEKDFHLTRRCLEMLLRAGFHVHLQTKSDLVRRDFDLLADHGGVSLCATITTMDAGLARALEPLASPPARRVEALAAAVEAGICAKAFVGPVIPTLTDTPESLGAVFAALAPLGLEEVYVDRLNLRWGVWPSLNETLAALAPEALPPTRAMLFNEPASRKYNRALRAAVRQAAKDARLKTPLNMAV